MAEMYIDTPNRERHYDDLLFDEAANIDADQDYWFKLRGDNINPLIDAATPCWVWHCVCVSSPNATTWM